ncbi:MAG TPA: hypothetical protein P5307_24585, partial [Pirellulaceae bacterium]|nr:hypothetical protein [Pirellulaceae bacterium]
SSIDIAASGFVGMGTQSPSSPLHVINSGRTGAEDEIALIENSFGTQGARDVLELKNKGNPQIAFNNTGNANVWRLSAGQNFIISANSPSPASAIFTLDPSGNLAISGSITTTGTSCSGGCDLVFSPATKIESIEEHAAEMWENRFLPAVGPTPENAPFNVTQKTGAILNELEKAHIYIEQLNSRIATLEAKLSELDSGK